MCTVQNKGIKWQREGLTNATRASYVYYRFMEGFLQGAIVTEHVSVCSTMMREVEF